MGHIAIVTPSYLHDLGRCELLAEAAARFASAEHRHVVIVPHRDLPVFRERVGRFGAAVLAEEELLPSWLVPVPGSRKWRVTPRGWPVRGWIVQQVVKIAYASHSTADAVLFADSDTCIVRPFDASMNLRPGGRVRFFAEPNNGHSPMHYQWHRRAGRLLGVALKEYSGHGFIGNFIPWVPDAARGLVRRLEETNGQEWRSLLLHERTLSEYVLYGIFVEEVAGLEAVHHVADAQKRVLEYWTQDTLSDEALLRFVQGLGPDEVAIHIQSKTRYSFDVYASAVRRLWESSSPARRAS
jgi:hypothetical protein